MIEPINLPMNDEFPFGPVARELHHYILARYNSKKHKAPKRKLIFLKLMLWVETSNRI